VLPQTDDLSREYLTWDDIDALIDHLLPQFRGEFEGLLIITRGGLVPGGYLAEAMGIARVFTAAVHFDSSVDPKLAWPMFTQFPDDVLLHGRRILIVDDIWATGLNMVTVQSRAIAVGADAETAVLHYRPGSNLCPHAGPDYYGAITDRYIVYPWEVPQLPQAPIDTWPISPD
jgi:hypothetical protein